MGDGGEGMEGEREREEEGKQARYRGQIRGLSVVFKFKVFKNRVENILPK